MQWFANELKKSYFLCKYGEGWWKVIESKIVLYYLEVKYVIQWGKWESCSTGFYHSPFLLCWERASPEGIILKTALYYTKQWSFPGEPCIHFATSVEERKKSFSGRCSLLLPLMMKTSGSTSELPQWFILYPFKNKSHVAPCCFAYYAH